MVAFVLTQVSQAPGASSAQPTYMTGKARCLTRASPEQTWPCKFQVGIPAHIDLGSLCSMGLSGHIHGGAVSGATSETRSPRSSTPSSPERYEAAAAAPVARRGRQLRRARKTVGIAAPQGQRDAKKAGLAKPAPAEPGKLTIGQRRAPEAQQQAPAIEDSAGPTLCAVFEKLRGKDPRCVLKVRKLHNISQDPSDALQCHFARVARVAEVLVVYSHVKARDGVRCCKPSGLGFVVLLSPDDAERALRAGKDQAIGSTRIVVERFQMLESNETQ